MCILTTPRLAFRGQIAAFSGQLFTSFRSKCRVGASPPKGANSQKIGREKQAQPAVQVHEDGTPFLRGEFTQKRRRATRGGLPLASRAS